MAMGQRIAADLERLFKKGAGHTIAFFKGQGDTLVDEAISLAKREGITGVSGINLQARADLANLWTEFAKAQKADGVAPAQMDDNFKTAFKPLFTNGTDVDTAALDEFYKLVRESHRYEAGATTTTRVVNTAVMPPKPEPTTVTVRVAPAQRAADAAPPPPRQQPTAGAQKPDFRIEETSPPPRQQPAAATDDSAQRIAQQQRQAQQEADARAAREDFLARIDENEGALTPQDKAQFRQLLRQQNMLEGQPSAYLRDLDEIREDIRAGNPITSDELTAFFKGLDDNVKYAADTRAFYNAGMAVRNNAGYLISALSKGEIFDNATAKSAITDLLAQGKTRNELANTLERDLKTPMRADPDSKLTPKQTLQALADDQQVKSSELDELSVVLEQLHRGRAAPSSSGMASTAFNFLKTTRVGKIFGADPAPIKNQAGFSKFTPAEEAALMDGKTLDDLAQARKATFVSKMAWPVALTGGLILSPPLTDLVYGDNDPTTPSATASTHLRLGAGLAAIPKFWPGGQTPAQEYYEQSMRFSSARAHEYLLRVAGLVETVGPDGKKVIQNGPVDPANQDLRSAVQEYIARAAGNSGGGSESGLDVLPTKDIRANTLYYLSRYGATAETRNGAMKEIDRLAAGNIDGQSPVTAAEQALGKAVKAAITAQASTQEAKESQAKLVEDIINQAAGRGPETTTVNADAYYQKWTGEFNVAAVGFTEQLQKVGIDIAGNEANIQATINDAALSVMYNGPVSADGTLPKDFNTRLQGELTKRFQEGGLTRAEAEIINYVTADPNNNMEAALKRAAAQATP